MRGGSIADITKIIADCRQGRHRRRSSVDGTRTGADLDDEDAGSSQLFLTADSQQQTRRCTCCCGREDCERAKRAIADWSELEEDLRLAAEVGQALLRKYDALVASSAESEQRHVSQRNAIMDKLTRSIHEGNELERRLGQTAMNLEAADSSNRALLSELDGCRRELGSLKAQRAKNAASDGRAAQLEGEVQDLRQELAQEQKRREAAEAKVKKVMVRPLGQENQVQQPRTTEITGNKEPSYVNHGHIESADAAAAAAAQDSVSSLAQDNAALHRQIDQLSSLLATANEELANLREEHANSVNTSITPAEIMRPNSRLGHSRNTRSISGGFDPGYRRSLSAANSPALADEIAAFEGPSRPGSAAGHRPLLLTSETRSLSRASARTDSSSPRLGGARLLSPTLPYIDPEATEGNDPKLSRRTSMRAEGSRQQHPQQTTSLKTEAQRIRAAYASSLGPGMTATPSSDAASSSTNTPTATATTTTTSDTPATSVEGKATPTATTPAPTASPTPDTCSTPVAAAKRDPRTAQLMPLHEYVQRLYTRLASADVDTLARRLQRQHLTGDVGHLARVTITGITRDAEGLREHFRRIVESEARGALTSDTASTKSSSNGGNVMDMDTSLVPRKDFFALVKLMRDLLFEMAKLRMAVNEVQLAPGNASKILQEHLGVAAAEEKGMGGWIGKLIYGGLGAGSAGVNAESSPSATAGSSSATGAPTASSSSGPSSNAPAQAAPGFLSTLGRAPSRKHPSSRANSRGVAAVTMPSTVAVEVKGSKASASDERHKERQQARQVDRREDGERATTPESTAAPSAATNAAGLGHLRAGPRPNPARSASNRLSRVQSRNLSGLFMGAPADAWQSYRSVSEGVGGAGGAGDRPLSRIVDDDEVSIHQGKPAWGDDEQEGNGRRLGHARGLSDSSIRSTFIDHGSKVGASGETDASSAVGLGLGISTATHAPTSRIMNRSTLALQAPRHASPAPSDDTVSTVSGKEVSQTASSSARPGLLAGLGSSFLGGFPSLRHQSSSTALSTASATANPSSAAKEPAAATAPAPAPALSPAVPISARSRDTDAHLGVTPSASPLSTSPAAASLAAQQRTSRSTGAPGSHLKPPSPLNHSGSSH